MSEDGDYENAGRKLRKQFMDWAAGIDDAMDEMLISVEKLTESANEAVGAAFQSGREEGESDGLVEGYEDALREALDFEGVLSTAWTRLHPHEPSDGWRKTREEPWYTIEAELHDLSRQRGGRAA